MTEHLTQTKCIPVSQDSINSLKNWISMFEDHEREMDYTEIQDVIDDLKDAVDEIVQTFDSIGQSEKT